MPKREFDRFCRESFAFLDAAKVPYLVIGGLAVVVVGEPRVTADADVVAYISATEAFHLLEKAGRAGFDFRRELERESILSTGTFRLERGSFHLDVILASLPFERQAFKRAKRRKLFGRSVRLPTPEDLILFKVLAGRPQDLLDAEGVVHRHVRSLDVPYLQRTLRPICELAEDMKPWTALDEVLRRGEPGNRGGG